ncbi:hypothetical protein Dimus_024764, partial [Dionaea muscipula]
REESGDNSSNIAPNDLPGFFEEHALNPSIPGDLSSPMSQSAAFTSIAEKAQQGQQPVVLTGVSLPSNWNHQYAYLNQH